MKICLYLEFYHFLGGFLYKNIGTGLLSSYQNQKKTLQSLGIEFTEKWDKSCDILQVNTPWFRSLYEIKKARRQGKKIIIWAHATAEDAMNVFWFNKYFYPLIKKYFTYAYGLADLILCPSTHTKNLLRRYGLPEEKLVVQSNAVDGSIYFKDEKKRQEGRKKYNGGQNLVVGTVGLVIPRKRPDIFINLAKEHPPNQFIWFGKIYSKLMAKGLPKNLPSNVKFTGYVDDILAAFNAIDIFVFLSDEENQGMVLLEAAALGLPILVRSLPCFEGWLIHNENCLMAKNDDELFKYLDMLLNDSALRQRLSEGAKKLAEKEDIKSQNKKLLEIYQKLLEK